MGFSVLMLMVIGARACWSSSTRTRSFLSVHPYKEGFNRSYYEVGFFVFVLMIMEMEVKACYRLVAVEL